MTAHTQDFIDLLNAEQHVQVDKLREHARHGISARVRGVRPYSALLHTVNK